MVSDARHQTWNLWVAYGGVIVVLLAALGVVLVLAWASG